MKYILFASLFLMLACKGGSEPTQSETQSDVTMESTAIKTITANLVVEGMTCSGCENTIKGNVASLDGVSEVLASHTEGTTEVTFDPEVADTSAIKDKIAESGYAVISIAIVN